MRSFIRILPIRYIIGAAILLLLTHAYVVYEMMCMSTTDTIARVFNLVDASFNHIVVCGLLYTPAFALFCFPLANTVLKGQFVSRRGIFRSLNYLRNRLILVSLILSLLLIGGVLCQAAIHGILLALPVGYLLILGLSYFAYFLTCSLIYLLSVELCRNQKIGILVVVAFGLYSYFLGMSPLRNTWLFQFGWTLIPSIMDSISHSIILLIKHFSIVLVLACLSHFNRASLELY